MRIDTAYAEIVSPEFHVKLRTIQRLLAEAYEHYFEHSDGHCKSSEGAMSIELPEYFWSFNAGKRPSVGIYSYVLGPSRNHHFENIDDALETVRGWHEREMTATHDDDYGWFCDD